MMSIFYFTYSIVKRIRVSHYTCQSSPMLTAIINPRPRVGEVEGYCSVLCTMNKLSGQLTTMGLRSIELPIMWNYTRIIIKDRLFLKPLGYKVMTIFSTHDCHFTISFRTLLNSKWVHRNITHPVWRISLLNHSLKSSTVEVSRIADTTLMEGKWNRQWKSIASPLSDLKKERSLATRDYNLPTCAHTTKPGNHIIYTTKPAIT